MKIEMQTIEGMLIALKSNKNVLGLLEYGSSRQHDDFLTGDYDLFVILRTKDSDIESLHFYINGIPVDFNIKTLGEIKKLKFAEGFETALLGARIIHDPAGKVRQELQKLTRRHNKHKSAGITAHEIALTRHGHKHIFDKIKGRTEKAPLLCRLLLNANIYWLIETYFNVRNMQFMGEKLAVDFLEKNEPEIFRLINDFYSAEGLNEKEEISKRLTELILAPVGGSWNGDELLAFGDEKKLQQKGEELFQKLFLPKQ
ncbi:MAG: hypothetical protein MUD10_02025 [Candidatus Pacebacteria bacterium]|jgi:hypothetical protein|nr:hypothetical protein [Candidatus Paceibacterota bacterium]